MQWENEKWLFWSFIEMICVTDNWNMVHSLLENIIHATNINRGIEEKLYKQLLIHKCGRNLRKLFRQSHLYHPEYLREPYVRPFQRDHLIKFLTSQINIWIRKFSISIALRDPTLALNNSVRRIVRNMIQKHITLKTFRDPTLSEGTLLARNNDEIFGIYLLETLDPCHLFNSVKDAPHPAILQVSTNNNNNNNNNPTSKTSHSSVGQSEEKNKFQIPETTMLSLQSQSHSLVTDVADAEVIDWSDVFRPQDVEIICSKLQGSLLPESLRGHLWIHRSLRKDWEDQPIGASWMSELQRLAPQRGISSDLISLSFTDLTQQMNSSRWNYNQLSQYQKASSVSELARNVVHLIFMKGFPIRVSMKSADESKIPHNTNEPFIRSVSRIAYHQYQSDYQLKTTDAHLPTPPAPQKMLFHSHPEVAIKGSMKRERLQLKALQAISNQSEAISEHIICRRAELLVRATYILTGEINPRSASIAILIMIIFPHATPVSEKTLKLFMQIYSQCLPSEHMNNSYSIATIATTAFTLLGHDDQSLRDHIQSLLSTDDSPTTPTTKPSSISPRRPPNEALSTGLHSPRNINKTYLPPPAYRVLKDWLETGFVGYVSEFAVMFLWDQFIMWGGKKRDWQQLLPIVCVSMLMQLKTHLFASKSENQLLSIISNSSKYIRSKLLFEDIRARLSQIPRPQWLTSSFSNVTLNKVKAVTYIQKIYRGHRTRKRYNQLMKRFQEEKHTERREKSEKLRNEWKHIDALQKEANRDELRHPPTQSSEVEENSKETPQRPANNEEIKNIEEKGNEINPKEKDNEKVAESVNEDEKEDQKEDEEKKDEEKKDVKEDKGHAEPKEANNSRKLPEEKETSIEEPRPDETRMVAKEVLENILDTLEQMNQRKKSISTTETNDKTPTETPLRSSRTRESNRTDATDYTMVSDDDDPIDVERLKAEMRSAYLKEWGDLRGLVFENDEEAERAFQESKKKIADSTPPVVEVVPTPPVVETENETKEETKEETKAEAKVVSEKPINIPPLEIQTQEQSQPPSVATSSPSSEITTEVAEAQDLITPLQSSRKASKMTNRSRSSSKSSTSSRRKSSLFQTAALVINSSNDDQHDSDDENIQNKKENYRKNFPQSELDALLGFFPELRLEISELLRQKRHLKLDISEWKADFFIRNGREATWEERKVEIGEMYERYHEVGYKANKALKELIEAEEELLKSWETRRTTGKMRRK